MSGNKIPIQKPGDELTKNAHYNWQLYNYFVGCVLFSRCLVLLLHAPGSWHDIFKAEMVGPYNMPGQVYESTGGIHEADSAFLKK